LSLVIALDGLYGGHINPVADAEVNDEETPVSKGIRGELTFQLEDLAIELLNFPRERVL
jgi:hypothetical protein